MIRWNNFDRPAATHVQHGRHDVINVSRLDSQNDPIYIKWNLLKSECFSIREWMFFDSFHFTVPQQSIMLHDATDRGTVYIRNSCRSYYTPDLDYTLT